MATRGRKPATVTKTPVAKKTTTPKAAEKVTLSPPWHIFYREIQALFKNDREIKVFYDENAGTIKLYVDNADKAEALTKIMPTSRDFGGVTVKINIYPADGEFGDVDDDDVFDVAFKGNEAYEYTKRYEGPFAIPLTYVVWKKEVVQYYTDNLGDLHGLTTTLYQDIAKDVLTPKNVFHCTNTETKAYSRFLTQPFDSISISCK